MTVALAVKNGEAVISVAGTFDFNSHREFRRAGEAAINETKKAIVIDLRETEYMDSSALGMLLVLKDSADAKGVVVKISGAGGVPLQVLKISGFDRLFEMAA